MIDPVRPEARLIGDSASAASQADLADREALALIAVERTRMPMVVSDPNRPDNPIVLANQAFLDLTGYAEDEVVGRNCRFLQGPRTDRATIDRMRAGIADGRDVTIELLNYRKDGSAFWNELHISPIHGRDGRLLYHFASQLDITVRRQAQTLERVEHRLMKEVDHRAKNALALVQGIVRLSRADDAPAYAAAVQGRVDSLARAHGLLAAGGWRDVDLEAIIRAEMEPFGRQHIVPAGPAVGIAPVQVQPLSLVFHEMLSNAARHGALATPDGRVVIRWHDDGPDDIRIDWIETGGPPVDPSPEAGFGWRMIRGIVRSQLRGMATFDLQPNGLRAALVLRRRTAAGDGVDA